MEQKIEITVNCPECGAKMHKAGKVRSGRSNIRQRWACPKCGRTTIAPKTYE